MQFIISVSGERDAACQELREAVTDAPEAAIRETLARYLEQRAANGAACSIMVSGTVTYAGGG